MTLAYCCCCWSNNNGDNNNARQQPKEDSLPSASNLHNVKLSGYLDKYFPKTWWPWSSWRRRFCVLVGTKIYYYESESSKGADKSSGVINLEYYDVCCQDEKEKKKTNLFILYSSNSPESLDLKHTFVADTSAEMNKWIDNIRNAIRETKFSRHRSSSRRKSQRSKSGTKEASSGPETGNSQDEETSLDLNLSSLTSETTLRNNATKERAKGPPGRRLPVRKSVQPSGSAKESERKIKSNSLGFLQAGIPEEDESGVDGVGGGGGGNGNASGVKRINEVNGSGSGNYYNRRSISDGDDLSKDSIDSDREAKEESVMFAGSDEKETSKKPMANHSKPMSPLIQELQKRYASAELKEKQVNSEADSSFSSARQDNNLDHGEEPQRGRNRNVKDMNSFLGELKSNITEIEIQLHSVRRDFNEKLKENNRMMEEVNQGVKKMDALVSKTASILSEAEDARDEYLKLKSECVILIEALKEAHKHLKTPAHDED